MTRLLLWFVVCCLCCASVHKAVGHRLTTGTTPGNRFLWAQGYEWYAELGLYRCGARFYDPTCAHWLQPDPIGQAGGLNLYAYCHNGPVNLCDPSGLAMAPASRHLPARVAADFRQLAGDF